MLIMYITIVTRLSTYIAMATKLIVGLGFQAMHFTVCPIFSVFMHLPVAISQNLTCLSSDPVMSKSYSKRKDTKYIQQEALIPYHEPE